MKHLCSYCGGWDDENPVVPNPTNSFLYISFPTLNESREVCEKCMLKGFDKLFGSLDKCDKCGEKMGQHHVCD